MIRMQQNLSKPSYLVGSAEIADAMPNLLAMPPFDARVLSFLQALSEKLRSVRGFSDVVTFSFWCRKAALNQAKALYDDLDCRIGRGVVFHIAPSNVPVNFAFSLVSGLLAGNANIVRVPSKEFPQVTLIATAIRELLAGEYSALAPYICLVRYLAEKGVNDTFSSLCDVRVIWGGDSTVAEVRRSPLKARATEITFADRYSLRSLTPMPILPAMRKIVLHRISIITPISATKMPVPLHASYFGRERRLRRPAQSFGLACTCW